MKFLANENFPAPSLVFLLKNDIDIVSVLERNPGITDEQVIKIAISERRTILTHDSDYGELIFKHGFRPNAGVIYFRIYDFEPIGPGQLLLNLINQKINFARSLTVVNEKTIRQRHY